jgi:hypothetical protein
MGIHSMPITHLVAKHMFLNIVHALLQLLKLLQLLNILPVGRACKKRRWGTF